MHAVLHVARVIARKYVLLCLLCLPPFAQALELGRARVLSGTGEALRVEVPIAQLSAQEAAGLRVALAPLAAWQEARLMPPVALATLQVQVVQGAADRPVIRLYSAQVATTAVADFLLDVRTPGAQQRHHLSVQLNGQHTPPSAPITVRWGDTLSALAVTHAVQGFSAYQVMAALYYANPQAFIDQNMNLVKAGAVLQRPDAALLARLSDRQARQLFVRHAQAWALRRTRASASADADPALQARPVDTVQGQVDNVDPDAAQVTAETPRDQLMLSTATPGVSAQGVAGATPGVQSTQARANDTDTRTAQRHAMQDTLGRIAQLEDNISALQSALETPDTGSLGAPTPSDASDSAAGAQAGVTAASPGSGVMQPGDAPAATMTSAPQTAGSPALPTSPASGVAPAAIPSLWLSLLVALAVLLGLVIWLLRRTRIAARQAAGGQITDAMIQEKLHSIDLNLNQEDSRKA